MRNLNGFTDAVKVSRYFDLYSQTDGASGDNLSQDEVNSLVDERMDLYRKTGLDTVDDDVFTVLLDEHQQSLN